MWNLILSTKKIAHLFGTKTKKINLQRLIFFSLYRSLIKLNNFIMSKEKMSDRTFFIVTFLILAVGIPMLFMIIELIRYVLLLPTPLTNSLY